VQVGVTDECMLCRPEIADEQFRRVRVWEDDLWRLSAVLQGPIPGFAHLEPKRHIPYVTDLDGPEALTLGPVLARVTAALTAAAGADLAYVYVFGDRVAHLHLNLAPHRDGDALRGGPGLLDPDAQPADAATHAGVADAVRNSLGGFRSN
jgi:diadenosine tetraphosphate (Ap4A) HIT family hydrolase